MVIINRKASAYNLACENGERKYHRRMHDRAVFYADACVVHDLFGRRDSRSFQCGRGGAAGGVCGGVRRIQ